MKLILEKKKRHPKLGFSLLEDVGDEGDRGALAQAKICSFPPAKKNPPLNKNFDFITQ